MDPRYPPGYPPQTGQDPFAPPANQPPLTPPPLTQQPLAPPPLIPPPPGQQNQPAPQYGNGLPGNFEYPWDPQTKKPPRRRRRIWKVFAALVALLILALTVRMLAFVSAISTEPLWSVHFSPTGDANVLILGYGGQGHEGA